jgi:diketogulonate reductase-like aldo/keto reductase
MGIAPRHGRTSAQIVFRFAIDVGMIVLIGTGDKGHMTSAIAVIDFRLTKDEVEQIERLDWTS